MKTEKFMRICFYTLLTVFLFGCVGVSEVKIQASKISNDNIIVDTHIDVPFRLFYRYEDISHATDHGQFDYPRAVSGGLNAPFMSIFVPATYEDTGGSKKLADDLIDMVEEIVKKSPDKFTIASSVNDVFDAFNNGLIALPLGMENGSPLENNIDNLKHFKERGISYITLTHSKSNHISDSSYDTNKRHGGLSDFGFKVVKEMNRVGIMVDISHVSDDAFYDVMDVSEVPVIASHSSPRVFTPGWERNMNDDMMRLLAKKGGVIQINIGSAFLTPEANAYSTQEGKERDKWLKENNLKESGENRAKFTTQYRKNNPYPYATLEQTLDVFDHAIKIAGINHVGIGTDYDGVGDSLPEGLKDVSTYPKLIEGFLNRGYSEEDIVKILSGNLLRVWREVEKFSEM